MTGRRVAAFLLIAAAALAAPATHACPSCATANVDSPLVDGAKIGVFLLLGVTLLVQGGFVAFFLHLRRCARRAQDTAIDSEWADFQRSYPHP